MRLIDYRPQQSADDLVAQFVPPARFNDTTLDNFNPNPNFISQIQAIERVRKFASSEPEPPRKLWSRKQSRKASGLYLDGGFGVGKTHLLAALWHQNKGPKAYLSFEELTAFIGFAGMASAIKTMQQFKLICIDEFELDDVANTLMVANLLGNLLNRDVRIATTSNTVPSQLGQKRFSATEFRRELASIANFFEEVRIDGPDYRLTHEPLPLRRFVDSDVTLSTIDELPNRESSVDNFDELLAFLQTLHPVQYCALVAQADSIIINDAHTISSQDVALLFVQFVDELYDAHVPVIIQGCPPHAIFSDTYRNASFAKKYGRALSRMIAMAGESSQFQV